MANEGPVNLVESGAVQSGTIVQPSSTQTIPNVIAPGYVVYNRSAAVSYANTYVDSICYPNDCHLNNQDQAYNWHNYRDLNDETTEPAYQNYVTNQTCWSCHGDCANFASQAIWAGGAPPWGTGTNSTAPNGVWWYEHSSTNIMDDTMSETWTFSPYLYNFMSSYFGSQVSSASSLEQGDLVFYGSSSSSTSIFHTAIVVGTSGGVIIDAHDYDGYHLPYNYYNTGGYMFLVHLNNDLPVQP